MHVQTAYSKGKDRDEFLNISVNNTNQDLFLLLKRTSNPRRASQFRKALYRLFRGQKYNNYEILHSSWKFHDSTRTSRRTEAARLICEPRIDIFRAARKKPPSTFPAQKKRALNSFSISLFVEVTRRSPSSSFFFRKKLSSRESLPREKSSSDPSGEGNKNGYLYRQVRFAEAARKFVKKKAQSKFLFY